MCGWGVACFFLGNTGFYKKFIVFSSIHLLGNVIRYVFNTKHLQGIFLILRIIQINLIFHLRQFILSNLTFAKSIHMIFDGPSFVFLAELDADAFSSILFVL